MQYTNSSVQLVKQTRLIMLVIWFNYQGMCSESFWY